MASPITLTTDFGARDPYVAAMKGVILRVCPEAPVVDLMHYIAPQDIWEAALFLAGAAPWFPVGTVHLVVVDPGVGTDRLPIAVAAGGQVFVCPDNGVLTFVLRACDFERAHVINNAAFMLPAISATFHGRDVFAPAAARVAAGADLASVGPPLDRIAQLDAPEPRTGPGKTVLGEIVHIDRFGNAITNIPESLVCSLRAPEVHAPGVTVPAISRTYGDASRDGALALIGSSGYLEIAVNRGSAAAAFGLRRGMPVRVRQNL